MSGTGENSGEIVIKVDADLEDLIPGFLENRQEDIKEIEQAVEQGNYEQIKLLGHSMKGSGGGYGFEEITRLGAIIEESAATEDSDMILECTKSMRSYLSRVRVVYE